MIYPKKLSNQSIISTPVGSRLSQVSTSELYEKFPLLSDIEQMQVLAEFIGKCHSTHNEMFIALFGNAPFNKKHVNRLFLHSVYKKNIVITKFLLEKGADVATSDNYAVKYICDTNMNNVNEMLQMLIDFGADLRCENDICLLYAMGIDDPQKCTFLINKGLDVHAANDSAIRLAATYGSDRILRLLIDNGADINALNGSPLKKSIKFTQPKCMEILLKMGANINVIDKNTLLSALNGGYAILKILFDYNINTELFDEKILLNVLQRKSFKMIKLLIDNGVDFSVIEKISNNEKANNLMNLLQTTGVDTIVFAKIYMQINENVECDEDSDEENDNDVDTFDE